MSTHQLEPWGSHGPRHTQQNSDLHELLRQIMWLQPPFFSIVAWHFGHSYEYNMKTFAIVTLQVLHTPWCLHGSSWTSHYHHRISFSTT